EVRDDDHHGGGGEGPGDTGGHAQVHQGLGDGAGERRFTDDAVEDADRGDPDLHGGQHAVRVFGELEGGLGGTVALDGELGEPGAARRDQRDLRHGEQAIGDDQRDE